MKLISLDIEVIIRPTGSVPPCITFIIERRGKELIRDSWLNRIRLRAGPGVTCA